MVRKEGSQGVTTQCRGESVEKRTEGLLRPIGPLLSFGPSCQPRTLLRGSGRVMEGPRVESMEEKRLTSRMKFLLASFTHTYLTQIEHTLAHT